MAILLFAVNFPSGVILLIFIIKISKKIGLFVSLLVNNTIDPEDRVFDNMQHW